MKIRSIAVVMTSLATWMGSLGGCTSAIDDSTAALVTHEAEVDEQWIHVTAFRNDWIVVEWSDGHAMYVLDTEGPFVGDLAELTPAGVALREEILRIDPRLVERVREMAAGDPAPDAMSPSPEPEQSWRGVLDTIPPADVEPPTDPDCPPDVPVSECT